jgi:hypothetical protein
MTRCQLCLKFRAPSSRGSGLCRVCDAKVRSTSAKRGPCSVCAGVEHRRNNGKPGKCARCKEAFAPEEWRPDGASLQSPSGWEL